MTRNTSIEPRGFREGRGVMIAMIREGLRSLRDRVGCGRVVRGCRSSLAQPPANGWHPSGMIRAARVDGHLKKMGAVWN